MLERRKQELYKSSYWTNNPKNQVQGPIPLSAQQTLYDVLISVDILSNSTYDQEQSDMEKPPETPVETTKPMQLTFAMNHSNADAIHNQFDFPTTTPEVALAPPLYPRVKWESLPTQTDLSLITIQRNSSGPIALSALQEPTQHLPSHTTDASLCHAIIRSGQVYSTTLSPSCIESPPDCRRTNETVLGPISPTEGRPPHIPSRCFYRPQDHRTGINPILKRLGTKLHKRIN
ncbi:hypothetical protein BGZ80_008980 [Entomortierella chlamydospora]|uniref:Uncharacterized protein n=1 Tax=Entomortierella chlamydospora TaxID=101097 RepID=A0A9P6MY58_9FUNG|nr:hypothetical protein BGZ80_008980 [Entomortierella chlamydospora]